MEITIDNYFTIESEILEDINKCDFIGFDLELSGLFPTYESLIDNCEERFYKLRKIAIKYNIIQVGLVFFFYEEKENSYVAKPYNIYVFPSKELGEKNIGMEIEALVFNKKHGCDFNKWLIKGVPYLNEEELKKLYDKKLNFNINQYNPKSKKKQIILHKETDKNIYNDFYLKFQEFWNENSTLELKIEKIQRHILIYFINKLSDEIRNKIYFENKEENNKSYLIIKKVSNEEKVKLINIENNNIFNGIKHEKGIKNLFEKIIEKKKKIIGHNCLVDILFIFNNFIETIPKDFSIFLNKLLNNFNEIYDTKFLCCNYNQNNKNNGINENDFHLEGLYLKLYEEYKDKIKIKIDEKFFNYFDENNFNENKKFHQADYDALVTGCSFIYMIEKYGKDFILKNKNKVNLIKSIYIGMNFNNNKFEELKEEANDVLVINNINNNNSNKITEFEGEDFVKKKYYLGKENINIYLIKIKTQLELNNILLKYKQENIDILTLKEFKTLINLNNNNNI
jgi:poly(A)-specific ribonuclease